MMKSYSTVRTCRNPRCQDEYQPAFVGGGITGLCPSCRLAGRYGAILAFLVWFAWRIAVRLIG